ncbi:hypothetical protein IPM09_01480 [Candidatus Saccharibacteria bacterium]|nr:MAG: hypothetical protein IPM09_01480 [Candidatus Saccharibacteria bacterium]
MRRSISAALDVALLILAAWFVVQFFKTGDASHILWIIVTVFALTWTHRPNKRR